MLIPLRCGHYYQADGTFHQGVSKVESNVKKNNTVDYQACDWRKSGAGTKRWSYRCHWSGRGSGTMIGQTGNLRSTKLGVNITSHFEFHLVMGLIFDIEEDHGLFGRCHLPQCYIADTDNTGAAPPQKPI